MCRVICASFTPLPNCSSTISHMRLHRIPGRDVRSAGAIEPPIDLSHDLRSVIGSAAKHQAVQGLQERLRLVQRLQATVEADEPVRETLLQAQNRS